MRRSRRIADAPHPPSSLCSSQGSSAPKSLGAGDSLQSRLESFAARTRVGWIPVTGTGMRSVWKGRASTYRPSEKPSSAHILSSLYGITIPTICGITSNARKSASFPQRKIFSPNCAWFLHCNLRCIQMNKKGEPHLWHLMK
ncbi:hypothetical protein CO655_14410 [Rhizobium sp. M1]|nr:hypothetical protein CO655_14410 [Rhizobium sp. M1]